jgi:hypothetical protein
MTTGMYVQIRSATLLSPESPQATWSTPPRYPAFPSLFCASSVNLILLNQLWQVLSHSLLAYYHVESLKATVIV